MKLKPKSFTAFLDNANCYSYTKKINVGLTEKSGTDLLRGYSEVCT
jgi:hypothetical protein